MSELPAEALQLSGSLLTLDPQRALGDGVWGLEELAAGHPKNERKWANGQKIDQTDKEQIDAAGDHEAECLQPLQNPLDER